MHYTGAITKGRLIFCKPYFLKNKLWSISIQFFYVYNPKYLLYKVRNLALVFLRFQYFFFLFLLFLFFLLFIFNYRGGIMFTYSFASRESWIRIAVVSEIMRDGLCQRVDLYRLTIRFKSVNNSFINFTKSIILIIGTLQICSYNSHLSLQISWSICKVCHKVNGLVGVHDSDLRT